MGSGLDDAAMWRQVAENLGAQVQELQATCDALRAENEQLCERAQEDGEGRREEAREIERLTEKLADLHAKFATADRDHLVAMRGNDNWQLLREYVLKVDTEFRPGPVVMGDDDVLQVIYSVLREKAAVARRAKAGAKAGRKP